MTWKPIAEAPQDETIPHLIDGQWFVGGAGPFRDNAAAWRWIDQHDNDPRDQTNANIRDAYSR